MKTVKIKNSSKEIPIKKIVCVGRNYSEHAKELGNEVPEKPLLFLKPASSVIFSGDSIIKPEYSNNMHHEIELVLLIGKKIRNAHEEDADQAIRGFGIGLDMTLRDVQDELKKKGHPWTLAKCFDTSAVLSEFIYADSYYLTLTEELSLTVNGEVRQKDKLNKMIFPPIQLVQYISSVMTLEEGDLIFTGTPSGVNKVRPGDKLHAELGDLLVIDCDVK
ncbi:MAG: fumarylacetoacetate hydrolase family protein [Syntrophothermus sp.]